MTVQAQDSVQYYAGPIASGAVLSVTEFTYIDNSHVSVKVRGDDTIWEYGTDYTVSGADTTVRTVTLNKAVEAGQVLAAYLDVPITQNISPEEGGNFPASTNEFVLDKLTCICQMLYERITRSLQVSIDSNFDGTLPSALDNKGKAIIINSKGTGVTYSSYKVDDLEYIAQRVYQSIDNVDTVADNIINVGTVATNILRVNTVANNIGDVNTVAHDIDSVNIVADDIVNVNTAATNITEVNTVATNIIDVNKVAQDITKVNTVATSIASVNTTATNITKVNTVAQDITKVNTVAQNITNVNTTAGSIANVNTVATNIVDVNIVADDITSVVTTSDNITDVNTVATNIAAVQGAASLVAELYGVLDGGTASSVYIDIIDGGNASSTYTTIVDGGNGYTVGTIIGDIQSELRAIENNLTESNDDIDELQDTAIELQSQITSNDGDIAQLQSDIVTKQNTANLVTAFQSTPDNMHYPSEKLVYDKLATKQGIITGAATTIANTNLSLNKVLTSNGSGKVVASTITTTELGYLSGLNGNVQSRIETNKSNIATLQADTAELQDDFETVYAVLEGGNASNTYEIIVDGGTAQTVSTDIVDGGTAQSGSVLNVAMNTIRSLVAQLDIVETKLAEALSIIDTLTAYTIIDGGNALSYT